MSRTLTHDTRRIIERTAEDDVADSKKVDPDRIDPQWPQLGDGQTPVSELVSDTQGSQSPYGDVSFPLDSVPYEHPETEINRS
ncbi:hypothetical protein SAMN06265360_11069 [Haloechinothrix alba]|uniref:Uncharacterized protein n=1 Tax=Haloechinothrix alba TaxID=664784 RepID=A0A238XD20_9PSEU|nr:hypothetical protein SAMN06265360_11069 [Haloechinothrix alba]